MRVNRAISTWVVAAAVVAWPAGPAAADIDPATTVKPLVVVLLDTSGSMEYESGDALHVAQEFAQPVCEEPGALSPSVFGPGGYQKSRLVVAREVLTGSIQDYWCQYDYRDTDTEAEDYGYPIPHVRACSGDSGLGCEDPVQGFDGLLDVFRDQVKFAVMTFDSLESSRSDADGMWSFGPDAQGFFGLNLGVRNEIWGDPDQPNVWDDVAGTWSYEDANRAGNNRGQLIAPSAEDDFGPMRLRNRLAQYEVNSTIGFWGTPLAPMLDDARWFLQNHETVKPYDPGSKTGDPYGNCRERTVILITDGRASQGEGAGGYPTTKTAIEDLKNTPPTPVEVYVVGFHLADEDLSVISALEDVADKVFYADTSQSLAQALAEVMSSVQGEVQSRTEVAYTNATRSSVDLQYQLNAAFQADKDNGTNLVGYLEQTIFRCSEECAAVAEGGLSCALDLVSIHERLNDRPNDTRTFYAAIQGDRKVLDKALVDLGTTKGDMLALFGTPQTGDLPKVEPTSIAPAVALSEDVLGAATDLGVQQEYQRQLIELVRADDGTARDGKHMGAITHTTPVVQEPARPGRYPIRSWNQYIAKDMPGSSYSYPPMCRPTVAFTGTHDGQIHAFRIDHLDSQEGNCAGYLPSQGPLDLGYELWSLTPQHLLKAAGSLVGRYHFLMDGRMRLGDVLLNREDPTEADPAVEAGFWSSVLTTGYGVGGRGFIALDVSNVMEGPEVLWEIDHEGRCYGGSCYTHTDGDDNDFRKLGLTTPRPSYGTAFVADQEFAIAILAAGDSPDDTTNPEAGRAVYVVRMDTGERVAEFSNTTGNVVELDGGSATIDYPMTGSPSVYSDVPGVVSTRAFIGDAGGRMWRLNMREPDPAEWELELFYDPYADGGPLATDEPLDRQPVFGAPALALDSTAGHIAVLYGTGDIDFVSQSATSKSGVFSVSEVTTEGGGTAAEENWYKVLTAVEKLTGELLVFDRVAYFTTYRANALDACDPGTGFLYGVHFTASAGTSSTDTTVAALDEDGDPTTIDDVKFVSTGEAVPYGVQIIERPACLPGADGNAAAGTGGGGGGGATQGDLQLVVNVAKGPGFSGDLIPPGASGKTTKNFTRSMASFGEMLQSGTWGNVLY